MADSRGGVDGPDRPGGGMRAGEAGGPGDGRVSRRQVLVGGAAAAASLWLAGCSPGSGSGPSSRAVSTRRELGATTIEQRSAPADAPNVVMLALDDQNDWLGFLGAQPGAVTPHLDALAERARVFTAAYCAAPMCLPSRTAVMLGRHPHETEIYDHSDDSDRRYAELLPRSPTLIDDFWAAGYRTFGTGKLFHRGATDRFTDHRPTATFVEPGVEGREAGRETAASTVTADPSWLDPYTGRPLGPDPARDKAAIDFGPSGRSSEDQPGFESVRFACEVVAGDHDAPFFLSVGLSLPHVPWRVPGEFFDLHPLDAVHVPVHFDGDLDDVGPEARALAAFPGSYERIRDAGLIRQAVQAYMAATSYVDWCYGQVLAALEASPHRDDTVVVLWSDHGFHLAEKLHFHKFTLWEPATRVPFLLADPRDRGLAGTTDVPVSLMDLGPTLLARCGLPTLVDWAGRDLQAVIDDPSLARQRPPLMTWRAGNHAVRRDDWRYIRYATGEHELYDLAVDPDELRNLAADPAFAPVIAELAAFLPIP